MQKSVELLKISSNAPSMLKIEQFLVPKSVKFYYLRPPVLKTTGFLYVIYY